jgi:uncharacterized protein (TIGR03435 family)
MLWKMRTLTKLLLTAGIALGQTQPAAKRPEFEVASIKPSAGSEGRFMGTGRSGSFDAKNIPLKSLIAEAYRVKLFQVSGGPGWIESDGYDITAQRDVDPRAPENRAAFEALWADLTLRLQVLLEDRCSLKVHLETKEMPVYALTIAKNGLKLEPSSCEIVDLEHPAAAPAPGKPRPKYCGNSGTSRNGLNMVMTGYGVGMSDLVRWLSNATSRTVIDRTGYTAEFNAKVEWTPDAGMPPAGHDAMPSTPSDTTGPTIFTALQEQLGLKLESTKGPVEVLVIDHVEKPSAN